MSGDDRPIAVAVRARMATLGMSQRTYSDHLGIRQSHLSAILHGKVLCPGIEIRRRMAEDLSIPHVQLLILLGILAEQELEPRSVAWVGGRAHPREHRWSESQRRVLDRLKLMNDLQAERTAEFQDFILAHPPPGSASAPAINPPEPVGAPQTNGRGHRVLR